MIGVFTEPGFFAREFLEMPFSRLCATLLQALAQGMVSLAVLFDSFTAERFTFTISGKVNNTEINTKYPIRGIGYRFRSIQGNGKIESTIAVKQVSLPFNGIHTGLLIATYQERDKHTTRERQERDGSKSLKTHNALVIRDSPFWPECGLYAPAALWIARIAN